VHGSIPGSGDPADTTPVRGVADANDAKLYAAFRSGAFRYDIPLANGSYSVTLGFLEPGKATAVSGRVFSVEANGKRRISDPVTITNGRLELVFTPTAGEAIVSNVTIRKQ
jgi:beta-galactosidase